MGQTHPKGEGRRPLQVRQARQGAHHHTGASPGGLRQLRNHRRPRHADRGHSRRPERHSLLQGQKLVGCASALRRILVFLAPVRRLQVDDRAREQERRTEGNPQENRPQIGVGIPVTTKQPGFCKPGCSFIEVLVSFSVKGRFYISRNLMLSPNMIRAVRNHSLIFAFILNNFN